LIFNVICYSDIRDKYIGLKSVILILEVFRYRHQSPFQNTAFIKNNIGTSAGFEPLPLENCGRVLCLSTTVLLHVNGISDIRYQIWDKTLFLYPIQCRTLLSQSNVGDSDSRLSPISLITDIGLSAHLCLQQNIILVRIS
jgi:hypothetical protein